MKKPLRTAFFLTGTVIGAGFASGKELVSFFGAFGFWAIFLSALCGLLFVLGFRLFMRIGRRLEPDSAEEINAALFGKFSLAADIFILLNFVIGSAAMLSASGSLFDAVTKTDFAVPWFSLFTAAVVFVCVLTGMKGLVRINAVIMPVLTAFLACAALASIFTGGGNGAVTQTSAVFAPGLWAAFTYAGMNFMQSFPVIARAGVGLDDRAMKRGTAVGGAILGALMVLIIFGVYAGGAGAAASDLPLLVLAGGGGKVMFYLCALAVWLALGASLLASVFSLSEGLRNYLKCRWLSVAAVLLVALTVSMLGFSAIVKYFFPAQGALGLAYIGFAARYEVKMRKRGTVGSVAVGPLQA
ncbi:MAG: hypothetical protein LBL66_02855 [Clostridiales bacterium]|nr:hypothetical protein [Clostridiales bacterium]